MGRGAARRRIMRTEPYLSLSRFFTVADPAARDVGVELHITLVNQRLKEVG